MFRCFAIRAVQTLHQKRVVSRANGGLPVRVSGKDSFANTPLTLAWFRVILSDSPILLSR
jgi:hypothetical protein